MFGGLAVGFGKRNLTDAAPEPVLLVQVWQKFLRARCSVFTVIFVETL
jgi:hypothetical protein